MTDIRIPGPLHEVLGERQTRLSLGLVAAALAGVPTALLIAAPEAAAEVPVWRAVLAVVLVADIAAGAVANLTRGTNDFYAARPRHRVVFLAVHVHLPLVALLLDLPLLPALALWAGTIVSGVVVERLTGREAQRPAAGLLLVALLTAAPLAAGHPVLAVVAAVFAFKVVYAFGVDHRWGSRS